MTEIEIFSYVAMVVSAVGITILLWWHVKRSEREALEEQSITPEVQEANVVLECGFHPDTIVVKVRQRVRLNFTRREKADCGDLMIPAFGRCVELPVNKTVTVEITPDRPGEYNFTCGSNGSTGRLIVEPS